MLLRNARVLRQLHAGPFVPSQLTSLLNFRGLAAEIEQRACSLRSGRQQLPIRPLTAQPLADIEEDADVVHPAMQLRASFNESFSPVKQKGGRQKQRATGKREDSRRQKEEHHRQQLVSVPTAASVEVSTSVLVEDDAHPIRDHHLSRGVWSMLLRLRGAGHEAYIVGGTIRDLLLGKTPKDVDVLTTATPHQLRRLFNRCYIIGRSFPIAQVHIDGEILEVSSLSTNAGFDRIPHDCNMLLQRSKDKAWQRSAASSRTTALWSDARRANALRRDFTVNALLYCPFSRMLWDYCGGMADVRGRMLRTVGDPSLSFEADPARVLRGVRIAARVGLSLDAATAAAIANHAPYVHELPPGRLMREVDQLLGYGAAAPSLLLLWASGVMEQLLPLHAAYLTAKKFPRQPKPGKTDALLDLLAALDGRTAADAPVDAAVWGALLALPLAGARIKAARKDAAAHGRRAAPAEEGGKGGGAKRRRVGKDAALAMYDASVKQVLAEMLELGTILPRTAAYKATQLLLALPRAGSDAKQGARLDLQGSVPAPPYQSPAERALEMEALQSDDDVADEEEAARLHEQARRWRRGMATTRVSKGDYRLLYDLVSSSGTWTKLTHLPALNSK